MTIPHKENLLRYVEEHGGTVEPLARRIGAANTLQEILTVKSDDVYGRARLYEAIVKGDNLPEPNVPESFNVLVRELMGLGLDVKIE